MATYKGYTGTIDLRTGKVRINYPWHVRVRIWLQNTWWLIRYGKDY